MNLHRHRILPVVLLACCWALFAVHTRGAAQPRLPVLIVVSTGTGGGNIGMSEVRAAFESQPTHYRGVRLIPLNLPLGHPARTVMDRVVLGLAPDRVGAFWIDQRIRSGTMPPRSITTPEMVLRVAASMRGVIGYVQMDPKTLPAGIEALSIDGKPPTTQSIRSRGTELRSARSGPGRRWYRDKQTLPAVGHEQVSVLRRRSVVSAMSRGAGPSAHDAKDTHWQALKLLPLANGDNCCQRPLVLPDVTVRERFQ